MLAQEATVAEILDGDTLHVTSKDKLLNHRCIRLIGVNAPELGIQIAGFSAGAFVESKCPPDSKITITLGNPQEEGRDDHCRRCKKPRMLAYVQLSDGSSLQEHVLREGWAFLATYPPNVPKPDELKRWRSLEAEAIKKRVGVWSSCPEAQCKEITEAGDKLIWLGKLDEEWIWHKEESCPELGDSRAEILLREEMCRRLWSTKGKHSERDDRVSAIKAFKPCDRCAK